MVHFLDGPGASVQPLRRAPRLMRVVVDTAGKIDGLDQIDDTPQRDETIHVYECVENRGPVHVCIRGRGRGRGAGGWFASGDYRHLADVDGELVRETDAWRQWCADRAGVPLQVVLDSLEAERARG